MLKYLLLFAFVMPLYAAIPVLGPEGVIGNMSSAEYAKTLVSVKEAFDHEIIAPLAVPQNGQWSLDRISIGVGSTGDIGVGPYKFGTTLSQRFFYTR